MESSRKMETPIEIKLYLLDNEFFLQSLILEWYFGTSIRFKHITVQHKQERNH